MLAVFNTAHACVSLYQQGKERATVDRMLETAANS
jgi:hypothetical protein